MGWPAWQDENSLCSYFYGKNYMDKQAGSVAEILLKKEARSCLPGSKFLHVNTHKLAGPVAGMKVQRCRRKLFLNNHQNNVKTTKWDFLI
jgi:hypothetical protein